MWILCSYLCIEWDVTFKKSSDKLLSVEWKSKSLWLRDPLSVNKTQSCNQFWKLSYKNTSTSLQYLVVKSRKAFIPWIFFFWSFKLWTKFKGILLTILGVWMNMVFKLYLGIKYFIVCLYLNTSSEAAYLRRSESASFCQGWNNLSMWHGQAF